MDGKRRNLALVSYFVSWDSASLVPRHKITHSCKIPPLSIHSLWNLYVPENFTLMCSTHLGFRQGYMISEHLQPFSFLRPPHPRPQWQRANGGRPRAPLAYRLGHPSSPTLRCVLQLRISRPQWVFFNGLKVKLV